MPDSLDLAEYLAAHLETRDQVRLLERALELLDRSSRSSSPEALVELVDTDVEAGVARNFAIELERQGVLGDTLDRAELKLVSDTAVALIEQPTEGPDDLVATLPSPEETVGSARFTPLLLALRQLIKRAESRLVLVTPFLNPQAVEKVAGPLSERVRDGVAVDIVTRALTTDEPNRSNRRFLEQLLEHEMPRGDIRVFEYIDDSTGTTLHTKLLARDGVECYLGSANITHYGLADNLEIGIICRGGTGAALATTAREITESRHSHEVERLDGHFQRR